MAIGIPTRAQSQVATASGARGRFEPEPGWICHRVEIDAHAQTARVGFSRPASASWVEIDVSAADPSTKAFRRYSRCQVSYHGELAAPGVEQEALGLVNRFGNFADACMTESGGSDLGVLAERVVADQDHHDAGAEAAAAPPDANDMSAGRVVLSLSSPCHQHCSFCSLKTVWQSDETTEALLERVVGELRAGRTRGIDAYTLNGFDPLSFAKVLETLDAALALGYRHAEIYSPCTLLADRKFCEAVVSKLPPSRRVHVPLYALDAAVHDRIVGRPGSYAQVRRALDHLMELLEPSAITITTVSSRENLQLVPALIEFAISRGLDVFSTMPYPATNAPDDRFVEASPRQTEAAVALVDALVDTPELIGRTTFGIAPCVILPHAQARGIPLQRWLVAARERPQLNGGPQPRKVPCRSASSCVLADACPAELFERYVTMHGEAEFQPVRLYDLLRAAGAAEGPTEGSARRASQQD